MKKTILLLVLMLNLGVVSSQELSSSIKNAMVEYLIKEKEYVGDRELTLLLKDVKNNKGNLFWYVEEEIDCEKRIRLFNFGSSSSHSKVYIALVKDNNEHLFIGADLKRESKENLIFNFIRFFDDEYVICFYDKVFPLIMANYKANCRINKNKFKVTFFK